MILDEYKGQLEQEMIPSMAYFINHQNPVISQFAIDLESFSDVVSPGWVKFGVDVPQEIHLLKKGVEHRLYSLKEKRLYAIIIEAKELLKVADPFENKNVYEFVISLENQKKRVNKLLGRTVIR